MTLLVIGFSGKQGYLLRTPCGPNIKASVAQIVNVVAG